MPHGFGIESGVGHRLNTVRMLALLVRRVRVVRRLTASGASLSSDESMRRSFELAVQGRLHFGRRRLSA